MVLYYLEDLLNENFILLQGNSLVQRTFFHFQSFVRVFDLADPIRMRVVSNGFELLRIAWNIPRKALVDYFCRQFGLVCLY